MALDCNNALLSTNQTRFEAFQNISIVIDPPYLQTTPLPEEAPDIAQRFTKKDVSSSLRNSESGMIDQVLVTTNVDGQRFVKVKVSARKKTVSASLNLCHLHW